MECEVTFIDLILLGGWLLEGAVLGFGCFHSCKSNDSVDIKLDYSRKSF